MLTMLLAAAALAAAAADTRPAPVTPPNVNIPLWAPGQVPLAQGEGPLDAPFLTTFLPPEGQRNGAAVIIAPGGANIMLMHGGEGLEVAEQLNAWGITAFVLTYRLSPRYNDEARTLDGQRAMQVVRARAAEWKLDPARIGFAGFSAGSSLGRLVAAAPSRRPNAGDALARVSSRPDFLVLVYSAGRATPGEDLKTFPPTFLTCAARDTGPANGSAELFVALNKAGANAEIHIYQQGRHGYGAALRSPEFSAWMPALRHFLVRAGSCPRAAREHARSRPAPSRPGAARRGGRLSPRQAAAAKTVDDGYGVLVYVPAGAFTMGDTFGDGDGRERPVHTVELDAFYIGKHEVTNAQWRRFRDDPGYDDPKLWPGGRVMPKTQIPYWTQAQNHGGGTPDSDDYPVLGVNWDGATAYCRWLSAKTGKTYRLPTEAEWEKAARGTDRRRYPWGNEIDRTRANYAGAQAFDTGRPVGFYDGSVRGELRTQSNASPYGAFDMAGNVMEWCQDWYARDYYRVSPQKNPKGPETGAYRVLRGGTFFMDTLDLRSYARHAGWPSVQTHRMVGFRPVRVP